MNNLTKISIIIPVYNVAEYISECIQSVMRQTYEGAIECIVVDDCSPDNSMTIIEQIINEYKGSMSFSVLHHDRNRGLSAARNTGMKEAKGDYIYFLDSDDYISDDCIEKLVSPLQKRDYDMVIGDYETFGDYQVPSLLFEKQNEIIGNANIFHELAERQIPVIACNKLYNLAFLKSINADFIEGQLHEDDLWTYKICLSASKVSILHAVTYYYRQRGNSIVYDSRIKSKQRFDSMLYTVNYILDYKGNVNPADHTQCALTYIGKCLSYAIGGDFDFYNEYKSIRRKFRYHPIWNFIQHKVSPIELKRSIHYAFPPKIGYWYFLLRRTKAHKNK